MRRGIRMIWSGVMLLILFSSMAHAEIVERRRDQFGKEFAYYLYPIVGEIPGLGKAAGFGASDERQVGQAAAYPLSYRGALRDFNA